MSSDPAGAAAAPQPDKPVSEPAPARNLGPLRMIWRETAKYPRQVIFALMALTVTATATLAIPAGFKMVVDKGFAKGGDIDSIAQSFRYLLMIVGVLGLGTAVRFYFVSWLGERVVADIRTKVQGNLLRLSPGFFEENSPNEISSRMTADTALIEQVVGTTVSVALRNVIMGIGGVIYLFSLAPLLTGVLLAGIVGVLFPIMAFARRIRTISRTSQDRVADIGTIVAETLGGMKVVQAFNQEQRELERFAGAVELTFATAKRRILLRAVITALAVSAIFGAIVLLVWEGAKGVAAGDITGGTIVAIVITSGVVAGAFGALTEVYGDLLRGAGAASRLAELLGEKPSIAAPERPLQLPSPPRGKLSFEKVTFRYPTRLEVAALADFSLSIEPGETVAIVGPSGAGKSTLFQLAERFYDPQAGTIKLDGVPLTAVDPAEVRRRMALVPQEGVLFAASARDNLRYGNWDASEEAIWDAARAANAEGFLRDLPEGLDTFLGEGGARLSGGQRQRIAIARAVLRDAPILLLDEATSALDAESEQLVQQALDRLMANRTTLVIAHRLATVR
ncbi:MAG TPA: ABC transporter transmembrane domain-containing protein, partial [Novosphingobium sp.]|nr:ABC transporter transmembrane domain-containing protein [Novosphingobium sp.]